MKREDFFVEYEVPTSIVAEPWAEPQYERPFDSALVDELRNSRVVAHKDEEVVEALTDLIHSELQRFGTGESPELSNEDLRLTIRALHAVANRLGVSLNLPFRDFTSFQTYWKSKGATESYQARRVILEEVFGPLYQAIAGLRRVAAGKSPTTLKRVGTVDL